MQISSDRTIVIGLLPYILKSCTSPKKCPVAFGARNHVSLSRVIIYGYMNKQYHNFLW